MTAGPPRYDEWTPEAIDRELILDFQIMSSETKDPWCICIVSKFKDPKSRLEPDKAPSLVPILTINAYGISPQAAQYEAYKQAAYFLHYGVLPPPAQLALPGNLYEPLPKPAWEGEQPPGYDTGWNGVRIVPEADLGKDPF